MIILILVEEINTKLAIKFKGVIHTNFSMLGCYLILALKSKIDFSFIL